VVIVSAGHEASIISSAPSVGTMSDPFRSMLGELVVMTFLIGASVVSISLSVASDLGWCIPPVVDVLQSDVFSNGLFLMVSSVPSVRVVIVSAGHVTS